MWSASLLKQAIKSNEKRVIILPASQLDGVQSPPVSPIPARPAEWNLSICHLLSWCALQKSYSMWLGKQRGWISGVLESWCLFSVHGCLPVCDMCGSCHESLWTRELIPCGVTCRASKSDLCSKQWSRWSFTRIDFSHMFTVSNPGLDGTGPTCEPFQDCLAHLYHSPPVHRNQRW